jgi:type II secretory pathway component HofQ
MCPAPIVLAAAFWTAAPPAPSRDDARVSLDLKDAQATDIVAALAEVGRFQVVFDPGLSCALTLNLRAVTWQTALDTVLRACRLGYEEDGSVLRVARAERLRSEAEERRRLAEAKSAARPRSVASFRLSYARAAEVAPVVKRLLSPRGDVVFDARTNTLLIVD